MNKSSNIVKENKKKQNERLKRLQIYEKAKKVMGKVDILMLMLISLLGIIFQVIILSYDELTLWTDLNIAISSAVILIISVLLMFNINRIFFYIIESVFILYELIGLVLTGILAIKLGNCTSTCRVISAFCLWGTIIVQTIIFAQREHRYNSEDIEKIQSK